MRLVVSETSSCNLDSYNRIWYSEKMFCVRKIHVRCFVFFSALLFPTSNAAYFPLRTVSCGPYGFTCNGGNKLRICEVTNVHGPTFVCPANTICNEDSSDVCESTINYIDPTLRNIKCHRNERLADPSVPGCKGYILCIPNKNRFQGIKFKCSGNTIFNGISRTCSSPERYKCPLSNSTSSEDFFESNRRSDVDQYDLQRADFGPIAHKPRPIDCKNYKFSVTQDGKPPKATYFCPSKPVPGESTTRCTVFSNHFCITLERLDEDQFAVNTGIAFRRPRADKV